MDRIARIIELEKESEHESATHSRIRWETSRLYWEEIEAGRTKADIARDVGKSAMHVLYMYRCWDTIVAITGIKFNDYGDLPSFNEVYNSDEIRKPEDRERREPGQRKRHTGPEPEDYSASGLARRIANCTDTLVRNPAFWPLLNDDDLESLAMVREQIRTIIRGSAKLSAQLRACTLRKHGVIVRKPVLFRVKPNNEYESGTDQSSEGNGRSLART